MAYASYILIFRLFHISLHPGQPEVTGGTGGIFGLWALEPSIIAGCTSLLLLYLWVTRFRLTISLANFTSGVLVLFLALVSPLDELGDTYLFSAHMLQHMLLILLVPPLLLLGTPAHIARQALRHPLIARIELILRKPSVAWPLVTATLWIWHAPPLYNAALANQAIHIIQHLSFLVTATFFWWPILSPLEDRRYTTLTACLYLFGAAAAGSLLGIYFTFTPPGLYPVYLQATGDPAILHIIRDDWGLTPERDQQLGGLIMWVPGGLAYLGAIIVAVIRWFSAPEEDEPAIRAHTKEI